MAENTPSISTAKPRKSGCQTCKTRRIKCDGMAPVCQRCTKSKRICIVVPASRQANFSFHAENQYATGETKRPRGPRSSFTVKQPAVDLETKALAYFLQRHLKVIPDEPIALGGLPECVAAWQASERNDPMVDLALSAMALAVYGNTQHDLLATAEASSKYHRLLQITQDRIAKVELPTLNAQDVDACLLTIFLMGRYESQKHRAGESSAPGANISSDCYQSWFHHEGVMAILEVWNDKLSHQRPSEIVKHTRRGQIRSAIIRSRVLPEWLLDGTRFGESGVELEYDRIIVRVVLLRQSLACHQQKDKVQVADVERLNTEGLNIDQALQDWISQASNDRPKHQHILNVPHHLPTEHFYSHRAYSYTTSGHAGVWIQYFAVRMLISSTRCRVLDLACPDLLTYCTYRRQRADCLTHLGAMADDLAFSMPYCLRRIQSIGPDSSNSARAVALNVTEEIKPYLTALLVWPLTIASSVHEVDRELNGWFRSELASIGKVMGDGIIGGADTGQWTISI